MEILKKTAAFRVQRQTEGVRDEDVTTISLSGVPALPELWSRYTHLTHLLLVCMKPKLSSLDGIGLSGLPTLRALDVSDNAVRVPAALGVMPSLARLLMPNNRVTEVGEVVRLAGSFPNLEVLDLVDNAVDTPGNFPAVFAHFPKLVALNSRTRDGAEVVVEDSDESSSDEEEQEDSGESETSEEEEAASSRASVSSDGSGSEEPVAKKVRRDEGSV